MTDAGTPWGEPRRDALGEVIQRAKDEIGALAKGKRWRMCVPVQPDDSDMVLMDALLACEAQATAQGEDLAHAENLLGIANRQVAITYEAQRRAETQAAALGEELATERNARRVASEEANAALLREAAHRKEHETSMGCGIDGEFCIKDELETTLAAKDDLVARLVEALTHIRLIISPHIVGREECDRIDAILAELPPSRTP